MTEKHDECREYRRGDVTGAIDVSQAAVNLVKNMLSKFGVMNVKTNLQLGMGVYLKYIYFVEKQYW